MKKSKQIIGIVCLFLLMVGVMTLAWPLNRIQCGRDTVSAGNDSVTKYSISAEINMEQNFVAKNKYLNAINLYVLGINNSEKDSSLTIELIDAEGKTVKKKIVKCSDLALNDWTTVHMGTKVKKDEQYRLLIVPSSKVYVDVCVSNNYTNEEQVFGACIYDNGAVDGILTTELVFSEDLGMIQTIMFWVLCFISFLILSSIIWKFDSSKLGFYMSDAKVWGQIFLVLLMPSVFNGVAFFSGILEDSKKLSDMQTTVLLWIVTVGVGVYWIFLLKKNWKSREKIGFVQRILSDIPLCVVVLVTGFMRIPLISSVQRWDAGEYYAALGNACRAYDFTLSSFVENFRLCTHSNLGFSFVMGIAEYLSPGNPKGVIIWNLLLTVGALACLYELITKKWLKCSKWIAAFITLAVSVTPLFFGTFSYFNVDYMLAIIFLYVLFAQYFDYSILMVALTVLLSQVKETGVVIVAGYLGIAILLEFIRKRGNLLTRIKWCMRQNTFWSAVIAAGLYSMLIIELGGLSQWTQYTGQKESLFTWSNTGLNCFGFRPEYIAFKCAQLFLMNYSWITSAIIVFCIVAFLVSKHRQAREKKHYLWVVFGGLIGFFLFSVFYITYALARYNIFFCVMWALLAYSWLYDIIGTWGKGKIYKICMSIIMVIMVVQTFWNFDPISSKLFGTVNTGKGSMLYSEYIQVYYGDGLVTNYQYTWLDAAYEDMLVKEDFNTNCGMITTEGQFLGSHVGGNSGRYGIVWNPVTKKRVMENSENARLYSLNVLYESDVFTQFPYKGYVYDSVLFHKNRTDMTRWLVPFVPYYQEDETALMEKYNDFFYISDVKKASGYCGTLNYYEMIQKDDQNGLSILDLKDAASTKDGISVTESISSDTFMNYMGQAGFNLQEVGDYARYLQYQSAQKESYADLAKEHSVIQKDDVVAVQFQVYDDEQRLSAGYIGNWLGATLGNLVVGENLLLPEIEEALLGASVGETIEVDVAIPQDYYDLDVYCGKTLHVVMEVVENSAHALMQETDMRIYEQAFETVWSYYEELAMKQYLLDSMETDAIYDSAALETEIANVNHYYDLYLLNCGIQEEEFLDGYVKLSQDEYALLKEEIAKANFRAEGFRQQGEQTRLEMLGGR